VLVTHNNNNNNNIVRSLPLKASTNVGGEIREEKVKGVVIPCITTVLLGTLFVANMHWAKKKIDQ
jgi:hypothetical protein